MKLIVTPSGKRVNAASVCSLDAINTGTPAQPNWQIRATLNNAEFVTILDGKDTEQAAWDQIETPGGLEIVVIDDF